MRPGFLSWLRFAPYREPEPLIYWYSPQFPPDEDLVSHEANLAEGWIEVYVPSYRTDQPAFVVELPGCDLIDFDVPPVAIRYRIWDPVELVNAGGLETDARPLFEDEAEWLNGMLNVASPRSGVYASACWNPRIISETLESWVDEHVGRHQFWWDHEADPGPDHRVRLGPGVYWGVQVVGGD